MFRAVRRKLFRLIVVSGAGAAANYFFDRDRGPERRTQAKEKAASLVGRQNASTDWQSSAANSFEPPPTPAAPTVTDILDGSSTEPAVDIPRTGPLSTP